MRYFEKLNVAFLLFILILGNYQVFVVPFTGRASLTLARRLAIIVLCQDELVTEFGWLVDYVLRHINH